MQSAPVHFLWQCLLVGLGGFFGSGMRFALSVLVQRSLPAAAFPFGTLAVNVLGCLLIGIVAGWRQPLEPGIRLFLLIGVLGGFTTFSTFTYETLTLSQQGQGWLALTNVLVQIMLCLTMTLLGYLLARSL